MNRLNKYRAKIIDTDKWTYGSVAECCPSDCYIGKIEEVNSKKIKFQGDLCLTSTLGQYTGENDNKNKEIYTGDIFRDPLSPNTIGIVKLGRYINCFDKSEMKFGGHVGFYVEFKEKYIRNDLQYWSNNCEVIGNIIDNPELMEG
jgi:uncharacterized phage protein (TIGR01671 family)